MRKQKRAKFVFFSCMLGVAFVSSAADLRAETEIGRLAVVTGDVRIVRDANSDAGQPAKANDPVHNGDVVKTGNGAAAKVLFTDQSIMDVGANSAFKVTDYDLKQGDNRTGTFSLVYGKLRALVTKQVGENGNVQVRTKDAVMGVRGTEFVVDQPKAQAGMPTPPTQIAVMSGRLQITPPAGGPPVFVGAGQMLTAAAPAPTSTASGGSQGGGNKTASSSASTPTTTASAAAGGASGSGGFQVSNMSTEQMTTMAQTSKTADNTFMTAVTIAPAQNNGQGGQGGTQGGAQQAAMIGKLVSSNMPAPNLATRQGPPPVDAPVLGNTNLLPPATILVGGLVHLTISVQ